MEPAQIIQLVLTGFGTLIALAGFAAGIVRYVSGQFRQRDMAISAVDARAKLAEEALARSLADHKLYAAEHFATDESVGAYMQRMEDAINRLGDRIDRFLETSQHAAPPGRRTS